MAIIWYSRRKWPFPVLNWHIVMTSTVKFKEYIFDPQYLWLLGGFCCIPPDTDHIITFITTHLLTELRAVCGTSPVASPVLRAKHWPCDLCSWPLTRDVDPLSRGMGTLYISTGRFHWLPARHLLWEMKPRRMPLLGALQAEQTTRPGLSPASE